MNHRILLLVFAVLVSGCVQQQEVTEITIPGHGSQIYQFSYDIRESLKVESSGEDAINSLLWDSGSISIVFNGTSQEDNGYFSKTVFNILAKLQAYYAYEGKLISGIDAFYYELDGWHNKTGNHVDGPGTNGASIWLLGPNTGAKETSVSMEGNIIYVQGTSMKDITMAGDKLALIAMGINSIEQIKLPETQ